MKRSAREGELTGEAPNLGRPGHSGRSGAGADEGEDRDRCRATRKNL
ncbi:hypothetical protein [Streptomyces sp. SID3343]|nr:hypothetical protein [Streptomyces sp. SID3343]